MMRPEEGVCESEGAGGSNSIHMYMHIRYGVDTGERSDEERLKIETAVDRQLWRYFCVRDVFCGWIVCMTYYALSFCLSLPVSGCLYFSLSFYVSPSDSLCASFLIFISEISVHSHSFFLHTYRFFKGKLPNLKELAFECITKAADRRRSKYSAPGVRNWVFK